MGSLGNILRREREARGISLEEVAEKTKISVRMLRAMENEQFERLPGGLFNKSFVRQYARVLGVDEDIAVREYLQTTAARREAASTARSRPPEQSFSTESDTARVILAVIGIGVLVAGIGYGGYRLYGYLTAAPASAESRAGGALTVPEVAPGTVPAAVPSAGAPAGPVAEPVESYEPTAASGNQEQNVGPGGDTEISAAGAAAEPRLESEPTSVPASLAPEELELQIASHGPVWLSITADGVRQWQGTMRANQMREVQAAESVRLTVGDAAAVSLTLNGRPLPGLGRPGEVRNLTITARDATESSP